MTFRLEISITDAAKRFPSDVVVHYRVPYFNNLETIYNNSAIASEYSDLTDEYTEDSSVGQYGLDFSVSCPHFLSFSFAKTYLNNIPMLHKLFNLVREKPSIVLSLLII